MSTKSILFMVYFFLNIIVGQISIQLLKPILEFWFPAWSSSVIYGTAGAPGTLVIGVIAVLHLRYLERTDSRKDDK